MGKRAVWQFFLAVACALAAVPWPGMDSATAGESRFIRAARHLPTLEAALDAERPATPPPAVVTGITVPHHLLAADLIARGVWAASAMTPARILILSPDHFGAHETPFGVTSAPLDAATGKGRADNALSRDLLAMDELFTDTGAAPREHGVHSVVPFLRAVFPEAPITAITATSTSDPADWRRLADRLAARLDRDTLLVQSTDYSHHLPQARAVLRDQETLAALSAADPDRLGLLRQPDHLDSAASQWLMSELQQRLHRAAPVIIANRSSTRYAPGPPQAGTTSYVTAIWTDRPATGGAFAYPDQQVLYLGGDVMTGRGMAPVLRDAALTEGLVAAIRARTHGAPLVVNLEGVLLPARPVGAGRVQHWIASEPTLGLLSALGVTAASLANNHAGDFGASGLTMTADALAGAGIAPLRHGEVTDLGPLRVLPLTFRRSYFSEHAAIRDPADLAFICELDAKPPLVVFAHWGDDYTGVAGPAEDRATRAMRDCGVTAVIGAHSHVASDRVEALAGGRIQRVTSLGNLIFDQKGPGVSGALAELRVFEQGTLAVRLVPVPNLYDAVRLGLR